MADLQPRHFENRDVNFETMFLPTQWGIKKKKKHNVKAQYFSILNVFVCHPNSGTTWLEFLEKRLSFCFLGILGLNVS